MIVSLLTFVVKIVKLHVIRKGGDDIQRPVAWPSVMVYLNQTQRDVIESYVASLEREIDILQTEMLDMCIGRAFCSIRRIGS